MVIYLLKPVNFHKCMYIYLQFFQYIFMLPILTREIHPVSDDYLYYKQELGFIQWDGIM